MKIIGVTNRLLCRNDFFEQIEYICKQNLYALILREKDLDDKTYEEFAVKCNDICTKNNVLFFINTKINIAQKLKIKNVQVSFEDFITNKETLNSFDTVAVSVHSLSEALTVQKFVEETSQNIFLIAGHIFETDCKKGLQPRGIEFLKEICANVEIPVFAIGGINQNTIKQLKGINIEGVCLMSELMKKSQSDFLDNL
ncbi:MAG: thiamine phosphate synthase [Elusimicrobia bacterium]|nr:thiamine phosphate synthase [Elusimicrobiota bacterium]